MFWMVVAFMLATVSHPQWYLGTLYVPNMDTCLSTKIQLKTGVGNIVSVQQSIHNNSWRCLNTLYVYDKDIDVGCINAPKSNWHVCNL